jgi:hypothetical protein
VGGAWEAADGGKEAADGASWEIDADGGGSGWPAPARARGCGLKEQEVRRGERGGERVAGAGAAGGGGGQGARGLGVTGVLLFPPARELFIGFHLLRAAARVAVSRIPVARRAGRHAISYILLSFPVVTSPSARVSPPDQTSFANPKFFLPHSALDATQTRPASPVYYVPVFHRCIIRSPHLHRALPKSSSLPLSLPPQCALRSHPLLFDRTSHCSQGVRRRRRWR